MIDDQYERELNEQGYHYIDECDLCFFHDGVKGVHDSDSEPSDEVEPE